MNIEDVTWINKACDYFETVEHPKTAFAEWFNGLNVSQRESVIRFAGWLDPKAYSNHHMVTDGTDNIFESLAENLNIHDKSV